jgi:hypothetical protein
MIIHKENPYPMSIIRTLGQHLQTLFPANREGRERSHWFALTLQAIIVPITASRTSNLLRAIETLFGVPIAQWRYYTFMASVKLPWDRLWPLLWSMIPSPMTDGRLLLLLDDSINAKTGKRIFGCQTTFDHAAKTNQTRYPWAQTIVTVGLLKKIHERWCCLPLAFAFYLRQITVEAGCIATRGQKAVFRTKFEQAVILIDRLARVFSSAKVLVIADSWFGNNGLLKPLRLQLGARADLLSRLRVNCALYATPEPSPSQPGRPRKYGARLSNVAEMAASLREQALEYTLHVYGGLREVMAVDRIVMLKTLRCCVRVVWVYRKSQWVALVTTDLTLSVEQIIEYYSARWKIEAGFREIKQEIGSADTQTRNPDAVTNHLHFCMAATTITWIYAEHLPQAPARRYASKNTTEYAFADVRRALASVLAKESFDADWQHVEKPSQNPLIRVVMRLVA